MRVFVRWLTVFLSAAALCDPQNAPEMSSHDSAPTFSSRVNLVLVPVVVRDGSGKAIGNLTKDDFQLFDRNKPQVISRFSIETTHPNGKTAAGADASQLSRDGQGAVQENFPERYVAYVFDDLNTEFADLARVQQAAKKHFSENLQPNDRAAIFNYFRPEHARFYG